MPIIYAQPGSISHGTLRTEDLLNAFYAELRALLRANRHIQVDAMDGAITRGIDARDVVDTWTLRHATEDRDALMQTEEACEMVDTLASALDLFAPPGHYFGAHPGDGSDFGFWPNEDEPVE